MEPHASKSTRVKPAGSLVEVMKEASCARASPAAKCVSPFWVGKPTRSTCARWYGKKTNRPSANAVALAALIAMFTSSNARAETRAPRFAVRVCLATRLHHEKRNNTRSVSLSLFMHHTSVGRSFPRRFGPARPSLARSLARSALDARLVTRASTLVHHRTPTHTTQTHPPPTRVHLRARTRERPSPTPRTRRSFVRSLARARSRMTIIIHSSSRADDILSRRLHSTTHHQRRRLNINVPLERGDGASGNGRAREHDSQTKVEV